MRADAALTRPLCHVSDYEFLSAAFTEFAPTAAVHFGEQRRCVMMTCVLHLLNHQALTR